MNTDIRIKVTFPTHPKTLRLIELAGKMAPWNLVQLWIFASQNRPKGVLSGMSEKDICKAAGWDKDPAVFIGALVNCGYQGGQGYLKMSKKNIFSLHDWSEHNPYCFKSPQRVAAAKKGASARWQKKKSPAGLQCGSHKTALPIASEGNAPSPVPSPSPVPAPAHLPQGHFVKDGIEYSTSQDAMGRRLRVLR